MGTKRIKLDIQFQTEACFRGRRNKFSCLVCINGEEKGQGVGSSKKEAEQNSARIVIDSLKQEADGGDGNLKN